MWIVGLFFLLTYLQLGSAGAGAGGGEESPVVGMDDSEVPDGFVVEGDMIIRQDMYDYASGNVQQSVGQGATFTWPLWDHLPDGNGNWIINYVIDPSLTQTARNALQQAIDVYEENLCFRFQQSTSGDHIRFVGNSGGCWSYIGRVFPGQQQRISLWHDEVRGFGCGWRGTAIHEIMHALGYFHEQARPDRGQHIQIFTQNIQNGREGQFEIRNDINSLGVPYDIGSVMHYSSFAFSRNGQPTILTLAGNTIPSTHLGTLSASDIQQLKIMYRCPDPTTPPPPPTTPPPPPPTTPPPPPPTTPPPPPPTTPPPPPPTTPPPTPPTTPPPTPPTTPPPTPPTTPPPPPTTTTLPPTTPTPPTTPPTTPPPDCMDVALNCQSRKDNGECATRKRRMKRLCENTCGFCDCEDEAGSSFCRSRRRRCYRSRWIDSMQDDCTLTCGYCGEACVDRREDCADYLVDDMCEGRGDGFFARNCRRTCGFCVDDEMKEP